MSTEKTIKRDFLREIESKMQEKWEESKSFEAEPSSKPKYFANFPYPYMNGKLHLGHCFTISKAEFAIGYQRMLGKTAFFPFAFHCTGMPIKACADKIKNEMNLYGNPPVFPTNVEASAHKHSKQAAKSSGHTFQWQIMESLGIPSEEISKFADPDHWLNYFPPKAIGDLKSIGLKTDWRRSFITTDKNPFYDSFVQWQFNKLKSQGKVLFGKRHCIYSPRDGQPCMDHDRASGEGVGPQEYTAVKMQMVDDFLELGKPYLLAATLRPETMYGQTNCWVGPEIEYGAFRMANGEVFICTERAATNLSYQGYTKEEGVLEKLADIKGTDLIGKKVKGPLSSYGEFYVYPMMTISASKGTGIVTSVPSDSPDDYAALRDFREKKQLREKFGVSDEIVMPFVQIPVLNTEKYGEFTAQVLCDQLGIKSQNDKVQLAEAKELAYKEGFYKATMAVGEYKGMPVSEAKPLLRQKLIDSGDAIVYFEPEKMVMSRSGDECVVGLADQWYINYGEDSWREQALECLEGMTVHEEVRHQFESTLGWLKQWACSRSFGLGTKVPWDTQYLIESLSDSTIYMAYYTVAHILHEGSLDGSVSHVNPKDVNDEVWEYVFGDGPLPSSNISTDTLYKMKEQFEYFYPWDLRVSGKDLVPNHLTMSIYNHVALFPKKFWPRSIRANGHLLLNGEKMSKSTGNFMTLADSVEKYSADGTRFALADAGDALEDANFVENTANAAILRLFTQIELFKNILNNESSYRKGEYNFHDKVFESSMNQCIKDTQAAYEATLYREALKHGFFSLQNHRDLYRDECSDMHFDLLKRFIRVQALLVCPIVTHFSEYVWTEVLGEPNSILEELFPVAGEIDCKLLRASEYLQKSIKDFRTVIQNETNPKNKKAKCLDGVKGMKIVVAKDFPEWQKAIMRIIRESHAKGNMDSKEIVSMIKKEGITGKKVIPFAMELKAQVEAKGLSVLERVIDFDETQVLSENLEVIRRGLKVMDISVTEGEGVPGEYFALKLALSQSLSPESEEFVSQKLTELQSFKTQIGTEQLDDSAAFPIVQSFAYKVFLNADNQERNGVIDLKLARAFIAAAQFLEVLSVFGDLEDQVKEKIKYAKWKAADQVKRVKAGEQSFQEKKEKDEENEEFKEEEKHERVNTNETIFKKEDMVRDTAENSHIQSRAGNEILQTKTLEKSTEKLPADYYQRLKKPQHDPLILDEAMKHAKWAISAMQYNDVPTALKELYKSIELLQNK